jgi:hypothetical protein
MFKSFIAALALFVLSGCAELQNYYAERDAAMAARQDTTCKSFGIMPGSDGYLQCRLFLIREARYY